MGKSKFKFITISILFLFQTVFGQNQQEIDSLKHLLETVNPDSLELKGSIYGKLIWNYAITRVKLDSAKIYTDSLHQFSSSANLEEGIAQSHFYYGIIDRFEGNHEEGLVHLREFISYFRKIDNSEKVSAGLYQIATIQSNTGNYNESLGTYYELLEIYKSKNDRNAVAAQLHSIGHILRKVGRTKEAIDSYLEAVKIRKEIGANRIGLSMTLESLGNTYSELKEFDKAEKYFLESLAIEKEENSIDGVASVTENLGNLFYEKGQFKKALSYQLDALKTREQMPSKRNLAICLNKVGKTYLKLEQFKEAEKYLLNSLAVAEKIDLKPVLVENYRNLITISEQSKNYKEGFKYRGLLMEIKDSILNISKTQEILELNTKYETEKKEREIVEQRVLLEKKERQKKQVLLGIVCLMLALIGMFIFFKNRIKYQRTIAAQSEAIQEQEITDLKQRNKLLAFSGMIEGQEAERLRIAKDLHDSLGGLLSTVKNHFSIIQKEIAEIEKLDLTKKTNTLIDEACIEVRRISHNMMPHALSISGLQGAVEDMGEQLTEAGYETTVEISGLDKNLDDTKKVMLYRLIQEIISNIRKHAEAKTILIQLLGHKKEIKLMIEDDGKGFVYTEAISKGGLGLKSINSRVAFLDGEIDWDSRENEGTTVNINIPV